MNRERPLEPESVLLTADLYRRTARTASLETELQAYRELSSLMAFDPSAAIQRFLDLALELCPAAGSAGLSELGVGEDGGSLFRWTAMSGALVSYVGGTTPREFSPCGLCLDHHHTILVDRPARVFTYFNAAAPQICEGLVVPLYDTGKRPLGTLWVVSHDADKRFDATDARVMEQLAVQLVLAMKLRKKAKVVALLEQTVRDKDMLVHEVQHRVKNTIQMTSALLHLHERAVSSVEARAALHEAQDRLMVLAKVYSTLLLPSSEVDAGKIDVAALIDSLVVALRANGSAGDRIRVRTDCDQLMLDPTEAVPIGLIVNEAVTNAFKHAYPSPLAGEVVVELRCAADRCSVEVRDWGVGFVAPLRQGSLGMKLMQSLASQLKARLTVEADGGTRIRLSWRTSPALPMTRRQIVPA